jgi:hypothetical protein
MTSLIRSLDWSNTPLGPVESWPQSLRTTVSLCLASNFPVNIIWGPQNTQIYNDGYRIVCGEASRRARHGLHPMLGFRLARRRATVRAGAQGRDLVPREPAHVLFRNGYLEATFFTFSLSPSCLCAADPPARHAAAAGAADRRLQCACRSMRSTAAFTT